MKRRLRHLLNVIAFVVCGVLTANAQELGVRFGGIKSHGGAAIDAVFGAGPFNRIHADLGIYDGGIGVDALWDFLYKPLGDEALNLYLGVGPSTYLGEDFWLGLSGEIGLEYRFIGAPIALGFDWRPTMWILEETKFGAGSFGLNIRFIFGNKN